MNITLILFITTAILWTYITGMCIYKKMVNAITGFFLLVFFAFLLYMTYCLLTGIDINANVAVAVFLAWCIFFYIDHKSQRIATSFPASNEVNSENKVETSDCTNDNLDACDNAPSSNKSSNRSDTRKFEDFIIGDKITDKEAYIENLRQRIKGQTGIDALREYILPEFEENLSKDLTYNAFNSVFPNVTNKSSWSRFKQEIKPRVKHEKFK